MTKPGKKNRFVLGMLIYALVFLLLTGGGYWVFWQFLDAYELSRPLTAVNDYLSALTPEHIRGCSRDFLASLDGNIQNEDQSFDVIECALTEEITAAKNSRRSTPEKMVYMLRSGDQTIGSVTIVPGEEGPFGFAPWQVLEDSFDFSYLLSEEISITVPSEFAVLLNGNVLEEAYITKADIPYPALEAFFGEFDMPTMVTYTAGNFLGDLAFAVRDSSGNPVEITADTDMNQFVPRCSPETEAELDKLVRSFLVRYTLYSSSYNQEAPDNYAWLNQLLVPNGELSRRLYTALDGLQYIQNLSDEVTSVTINGIYQLSEERYLCDVSYTLRTIGRKGAVEMAHNMKVVYLQTRYGLRVEAMTRY